MMGTDDLQFIPVEVQTCLDMHRNRMTDYLIPEIQTCLCFVFIWVTDDQFRPVY